MIVMGMGCDGTRVVQRIEPMVSVIRIGTKTSISNGKVVHSRKSLGATTTMADATNTGADFKTPESVVTLIVSPAGTSKR